MLAPRHRDTHIGASISACIDMSHRLGHLRVLLQGDAFTEDVISTWIWYKRAKEVDEMRQRPHPYEFCL